MQCEARGGRLCVWSFVCVFGRSFVCFCGSGQDDFSRVQHIVPEALLGIRVKMFPKTGVRFENG